MFFFVIPLVLFIMTVSSQGNILCDLYWVVLLGGDPILHRVDAMAYACI